MHEYIYMHNTYITNNYKYLQGKIYHIFLDLEQHFSAGTPFDKWALMFTKGK